MRKAVIYSWGAALSGAIYPLLILPLAVKALPPETLSLFLFFNVITSVASLADAGISQSVARAYVYFRNGHRKIPNGHPVVVLHGERPAWVEGLKNLEATSSIIFVFAGLLASLLALGCGFLGGANLLRIAGDRGMDRWAVMALSASVFFQFQNLKVSAWLTGWDRVAQQKQVEFWGLWVKAALVAGALITGRGLVGVAAAMLLTQWFIWIFLATSRRGEGAAGGRFSWEICAQIFPSSWRTGAIAIGGFLITQGASLVAVQGNDSAAINGFLLTVRLVTIAYTIASVSYVPSLPKAAGLLARGDVGEYARLLSRSVAISVFVYGVCCVGVLVVRWDPFEFLPDRFQFLSAPATMALLVVYFLEMHHVLHANFYQQTNHVPFLASALISGLAVAIGSAIFEPIGGAVALISVQFLVQLVWNNWYPVALSLRLGNISPGKYLRMVMHEFNSRQFLEVIRR